MNFRNGTFTIGSTGNLTVAGWSFQPKYIRFTLSGRFGVTETATLRSTGWTAGTNQSCHSFHRDSNGALCRAFTNRIIHHYQRESGVMVDNIVATFVSFNSDGFTINATAADPAYQVHYEAFG
jgi:hypothetical protein